MNNMSRITLINAIKTDKDLNELWYNCFDGVENLEHINTHLYRQFIKQDDLFAFLNPKDSSYRTWLIQRKEEKDIIGFIYFGDFLPDKFKTVGFCIGLKYCRQGYATESINLLLEMLGTISGLTSYKAELLTMYNSIANTEEDEEKCSRVKTADELIFEQAVELAKISTEFAGKGKLKEAKEAMKEALDCAAQIDDEYWKTMALAEISTDLAHQSKLEDAAALMNEALQLANSLKELHDRDSLLEHISYQLALQGHFENSLKICRNFSDERQKSRSLYYIALELARIGRFEESMVIIDHISDDYWKSLAMLRISSILANTGKFEEAALIIQKVLSQVQIISSERDKCEVLHLISIELAKRRKFEEAKNCSNGISDDYYRLIALVKISTELASFCKYEEAIILLKNILNYANNIDYAPLTNGILNIVKEELLEQIQIGNTVAEINAFCAENNEAAILLLEKCHFKNFGFSGKIYGENRELWYKNNFDLK
jgi:RimJ/RimL family protein N-acetyltransferase